MVSDLPKCLKCGGKVLRDCSELRCLNCGMEWKSPREKTAWYDSNREDILKDVRELGQAKACGKWLIPKGSLSRLLSRWTEVTPENPVPVRTPTANVMLPGLPAFSDSWPETVQIKWLETYLAILIYRTKEV